jgi:hypothetical protein
LDLDPKNIANAGLASYFQLDTVYLTHPPLPTVRHLQDH